ncbi:hypothetical protein FJ444_18080 [Aestuariibacter sp. GS-14]|uniref:hypothetical protein n=1 Tax=Alteromonadaceae TaxID=72275 RepID=UPI001129CA23|nr:hypothetical protein [Aestuariibacter sp. GS-14]TPV54766.1 hypothetical protein FJ444_18080 [Aestuariibacter sp. GS-14]
MQKLAVKGFIAFLGLFVGCVQANDDLSWHGFIAQGITQSQHSAYITDDNAFTFESTEVGINAIYTFNSNVSVAGQLVYLDGGNRYRQGSRVDYLFLDWRVAQYFDWQMNLHLGRYKNRHWLYSATQDVPHTRPSIILPQSVYYDGNRDMALSSDGIALQSTKVGDSGSWEVRWSLGRSPLAREETEKFLSPLAQGRVKQDIVHQFSTYWQPNFSQWQIGFSLLQSDFTYKPAEQDILLNGNSTIERLTLAVRYDSENWEFSSELLRDRLRYRGDFTQGVTLDIDKTGEGGYAQFRYFLTDAITGLMRIDSYDVDRKDRDGRLLDLNPLGPIPRYYGYMDTATLGLSWDFAQQMRVSAELSRTRGAGRLATVLFPSSLIQADPFWNTWSVQFMYWF